MPLTDEPVLEQRIPYDKILCNVDKAPLIRPVNINTLTMPPSSSLRTVQKQNVLNSNQNIFYPVEPKDCEKILKRKMTSVREGVSNIINNLIK